jgi:hypothetical protein
MEHSILIFQSEFIKKAGQIVRQMKIIFFYFLFPMIGFAQVKSPVVLKTTPWGYVNPFQQTGDLFVDIPLSTHWGLELGAVWVANSLVFARYKGETYKGYKLKPALKYYFKRTDGVGTYLSLALKYHQIHYDRYYRVERQGGQYTDWILRRRAVVAWGASVRFGTQQYLDSKKRWIMEPFMGLGVRRKKISLQALPLDAAQQFDTRQFFSILRQPGIYLGGDLLVGIYLGYTLKRKAPRR